VIGGVWLDDPVRIRGSAGCRQKVATRGGNKMKLAELFLYDIDKLAKKLSDEFGSLSYDKFVEDTSKIESAILGFMLMKEG